MSDTLTPGGARETRAEFKACVEKIRQEAFSIPPPNPYTPQILLWCIWLDNALDSLDPSPDSKLEAYRKALEEISKQLTMGELIAEYGEDYLGDPEAGYDAIIMIARKALAAGG